MKSTEASNSFTNLEQWSTSDLVTAINKEDRRVAEVVGNALPQITALAEAVYNKLKGGGRLFYIGAGTSGRLGILDASECPPTYGVPHGMVVGIIAGGDSAIRRAVEFAEDDPNGALRDLQAHQLNAADIVVGIAASGSTPYVVGGLSACRNLGIITGCVVCNSGSEVAAHSDLPVEVIVGPEFVTGSTRMKAGTAQKMVLNMITTSAMIRLGRVRGNRMVDMQLTNNKLIDRGVKMVMAETGLGRPEAAALLATHGNVRAAVDAANNT